MWNNQKQQQSWFPLCHTYKPTYSTQPSLLNILGQVKSIDML